MVTTAPRRTRGRPLRVERDDVLLFFTSRTVEERFWLHPLLSCALKNRNRRARRKCVHLERRALKRYDKLAARANARSGPYARKFTGAEILRIAKGLMGSALARAQEKAGVEIFAFVAMSNHVHAVIRTPRKNAAEFSRLFKSVVARTINRITGRSGPLWARRADIQPVLDDAACAGRVAYCVDNPRKANLVEHAEHWPGLNLCYGLGDADELEFEYFDTSAWNRAGRPDDIGDFFEVATLKLSPLPSSEGSDREAYAKDVRKWVAQRLREDLAELDANDEPGRDKKRKTPLGIDKVIDSAFDQRPKQSKMTRRPYCFGSPERRREHYEQTSMLLDVYAQRSESYRLGERLVEFPPGTYPPPVLAAA
jgi:REP element-mobilizing transposase RayT